MACHSMFLSLTSDRDLDQVTRFSDLSLFEAPMDVAVGDGVKAGGVPM
jgi:hypothetical protein